MAAFLQRRLAMIMVWTAFYEQLAWTTVLVLLASADRSAVAWGQTAYSLANMVGNILFGIFADRFNRDRVAGIGLLAMSVTTLLHLLGTTLPGLVSVRFLHGFAAAALAPAALARVSDGAPEARQGESLARAGLFIALASMVSPPVTGIMARRLGVSAALGTLALGLLVVGILVLRFQRASAGRVRPIQAAPVAPRAEAPPTAPPARVEAGPILITSAVAFALMFGQNVLFYAFQLKTADLGMDSAMTGRLLSAFAIGSVLAFVPPLARVVDRVGVAIPLATGMVLAGIGMWGLAPAVSSMAISGALMVYGLGFGLAFTAVAALGANSAGRSHRSLGFGILTAAFSAGAIVGPALTRSIDAHVSPFVVSAVLSVATAVLYTAVSPMIARSR